MIAITLTKTLNLALSSQGIDPANYGPAYDGESIGLDLYNDGPDLVVPSIAELNVYDNLESLLEMSKVPTWLDYEESERKRIFKTLMPTGVRAVIPSGFVGLVRGRGSVSKSPLLFRAGVIDPGYTGQIWVNVINVSTADYVIPAGAKSPFQLVVLRADNSFQTVDEDIYEALAENAKRKAGQIGSSDTQKTVIADTVDTINM